MNGQAIASQALAQPGPLGSAVDPPGQARPEHIARVGPDGRRAAAAAAERMLRATRP